jgi:hypothetical protein
VRQASVCAASPEAMPMIRNLGKPGIRPGVLRDR